MLRRLMRGAVTRYAMTTGRARSLYHKVGQPGGAEFAEFLRRHGGFHAIGEDCYIDPWANIPDPAYVRIGNNVRISNCSIFGHDGSVNMINRAFGLALDKVGKVDIRDNVFIGHGCIIQPGVTIGPNAIVCAGTVVNRDVDEGMVVAGIPAKTVCPLATYVQILKARNQRYPWRHLIERRGSDFDPEMEAELDRLRVLYFYPPHGERPDRAAGLPPAADASASGA